MLAKDTPLPSVFSHQILNAMPYAFLDDAPLEERRARAVFLRRALPDNAAELGRLDPEAIRRAAEDAWPAVRDQEELHDLLFGLVLFPEAQLGRLPEDAAAWFGALERACRARLISWGSRRYWMAAEREELVTGGEACPRGADDGPGPEAVAGAVRGWMEVSGPMAPGVLAGLPWI